MPHKLRSFNLNPYALHCDAMLRTGSLVVTKPKAIARCLVALGDRFARPSGSQFCDAAPRPLGGSRVPAAGLLSRVHRSSYSKQP